MEGRGRAVALVDGASDRYERLYAMLLDSIPSSVLLIDQNLHVSSANRNFLVKSERTSSGTIGQPLENVLPEVILDKLDIADGIRRVIGQNRPIVGERMTFRAPGIPTRMYFYSILPFLWEGKVEGAILLMDDVTEQTRLGEEVRSVERLLASIVNSASDIIVSADPTGKILTWNEAAERHSGFAAADALSRPFFDFCSDEDRKDVEEIFALVVKGNVPHVRECAFRIGQSQFIPVSWALSPLKGGDNSTVGVVAVGRDLTERRRLEAELFQAHKLAALGVMAGGIAHEIRNPLSICSSSAQFLLNENVSPEFHRQCVEKILRGVQRASLIIENLLKYSHPCSTTQKVRLNLIPLIRETLDLVDSTTKIQKIDIAMSFSRESVEVEGVPTLLQQVFMNILLNAINAMPNGGHLKVLAAREGSAMAIIQISDTGCGIPQNALAKIFDPFYTHSTIGTASGLGLFFCYTIVKQHGGSIEVQSAERKGSTFTVKLPLRGAR